MNGLERNKHKYENGWQRKVMWEKKQGKFARKAHFSDVERAEKRAHSSHSSKWKVSIIIKAYHGGNQFA